MPERYARYQRLLFDRPHPRVLRITMHNPGRLNSADAIMHRELVEIWRDIDADAGVSAAILTGAGKAFSTGGDFDMIGNIIDDFLHARGSLEGSARSRLQPDRLFEARGQRHARACGRSGPGVRAVGRHLDRQ